MSRVMRRLYGILSAFLVLTLAGCGGGSHYSTGWGYGDPQPSAQTAPSSLSRPYVHRIPEDSALPELEKTTQGKTFETQTSFLNAPPTQSDFPFAEPPPIVPKTVTKVGLLLPLSGERASLGQAMLKAAQMALFDIGQGSFQMIPHDTKGTPEGARAAAELAVKDGTQLILGPVFAPSVRAAKRVAQNADIPMISFSTDWTLAGGNTFIMGFLPFDQVERVVAYAAARSIWKVGVLAPETDYGNAVLQAYNNAAYARGLTTVKIQKFEPGSKNLSPIIREFSDYDDRLEIINQKIRPLKAILKENPRNTQAVQELLQLEGTGISQEIPYDAILLPVGGDLARAITNLASHYDLPPSAVRRLGTGLWDDPGLAAEPSLEGAWFAAPSPHNREAFEARYKKAYKTPPPRLSSLAYDATALAAVLTQKGLQTTGAPAFKKSDITNPNGFAGIDGIFRFRQSGIVERGLAVLEFRDGQIIIVDPAPQTFERLGYN